MSDSVMAAAARTRKVGSGLPHYSAALDVT